MPSVDAATRRLICDSFELGFIGTAGATAGWADRFITTSDSFNHLAAFSSLRFLGIWIGSAWRTNSSFSFVDNGNGTATLTWTFATGNTVAVLATPHAEWIEFEITAESGIEVGSEELVLGLQTQGFVMPGDLDNDCSMYQRTADLVHAWGFVNGNFPWHHTRSGDAQLRLKGSTTNGMAGWVGKKCGVYIATAARGRELLPLIAAALGVEAGSRSAVNTRSYVLFTDAHTANGGTATPDADLANRMADLCDQVGAEEALLGFHLWRDFDNVTQPLSGVLTLVQTLQSRGIKVGLHAMNYCIRAAHTGPNSYKGLYPGQWVASETPFIRPKHFYDGLATLNAFQLAVPVHFAGIYTALGCDGGNYLDGIGTHDVTNDAFNSTLFGWFFHQQEFLDVTALLPGVPIYGSSSRHGITLALVTRAQSSDLLGPGSVNDEVDTEVVAPWLNEWSIIGVPRFECGWWCPTPDGGATWRTQAELEYWRNATHEHDGRFALLGTVDELEDAAEHGLNLGVLSGETLSELSSGGYDAIKAALQEAGGPFTAPNSVEFWVDQAEEELGPNERLLQALCRPTPPHCLICDSGGDYDDAIAGGGNTHEERTNITLYYSCGAPAPASNDYEQAQQAGGQHYWGEFPVRQWILNQVCQAELPGWVDGISPVSRRVIANDRAGVITMALTVRGRLLHVYDD